MDRTERVTRRGVLGAGAATALGVGTAGCQTWLDRGSAGPASDATPTGDATDTTAADDEPLEVLHGWTDGPARQGARALADAFEERYPETALTVQAVGGTSETDYDRHLRHRFYDEIPPARSRRRRGSRWVGTGTSSKTARSPSGRGVTCVTGSTGTWRTRASSTGDGSPSPSARIG